VRREKISSLSLPLSLPRVSASPLSLIPLDYAILQKMVDLKEIPELHDKIIVSTARYLNSPIVTKDRVLQNLPYIKTLW
jgi:PIN domain nuclease of toxin-antitoxin system